MKKAVVILAILIITACSSDDSKEAVIEVPVSERLEYEFNTLTEIPNGTGEFARVIINVPEDRVVIDPTKVFIEITLDHYEAGHLTYGYVIPNDDNTYRIIVNNLGGTNDYDDNNVLSFNPNHTDVINATENYPGNVVPQGNYRQGAYPENVPIDTPLFSQMMGKNIQGPWKFFFLDHVDNIGFDHGNLVKIKLIFDEGALEIE